jgi:hypothetical protein|tara:strand:+ start:30 stop:218 length:189 start_codon:yes stop_codon:yes gene_type:complete
MKVGDLVRVERPISGRIDPLVGQLGVIIGEGPLAQRDQRVLLTNGKEFWFEASELEVIDESR